MAVRPAIYVVAFLMLAGLPRAVRSGPPSDVLPGSSAAQRASAAWASTRCSGSPPIRATEVRRLPAATVGLAFAVERQLSAVRSSLEQLDEFAVKDVAEDLQGWSPTRFTGNPAGAIGADSASADQAVRVGMMHQFLAPSVEHGQDADFGSQVLGVGNHFFERFRHCLKQDTVHDPFILQGERAEFPRQGKDHVKVRDG